MYLVIGKSGLLEYQRIRSYTKAFGRETVIDEKGNMVHLKDVDYMIFSTELDAMEVCDLSLQQVFRQDLEIDYHEATKLI